MKSLYNRVCITGTVYNLFLYLLISTLEEYNRTFFFVGHGIPEEVRNKIDNKRFMPYTGLTQHEKKWAIIKCKLLSRIYYPFLDNSKIFAQDHYPYMPYIVGNRKYTFIEDGPNIFSITQPTEMWKCNAQYLRSRNFWQKLKDNFVSKAIAGIMANNELCTEVIVTTPDYISYLDGKKFTQIDIKKLWENSSVEKKKNIMRIFDISDDDITYLSKKKNILFTQPFAVDGELTEEEQFSLYKNSLSKYNLNDVIIKTHPRDTFDYKKYFPECLVFSKPVPFQLLDLFNIRFNTAITVCSTAVTSIPYDIKIDWIGASVHPNILKNFGDIIPKEIESKLI